VKSALPRVDAAGRAIAGVVTAGLVVMAARVVQLQMSPSARLRDQVQPRVSTISLNAERSEIVDRRGRPLATSHFGWQVFIDPTQFPAEPDEPIARLAETLSIRPDELGRKVLLAIAENHKRAAAKPAEPEPAPPSLKQWFRGITSSSPHHGDIRVTPVSTSTDAAVSSADMPSADIEEVSDDPNEDVSPPGPIRYIRITGVIDEPTVKSIRALKIKGVHLEQKLVREYPGGAAVAPIVGRLGALPTPQSGTERSHHARLSGQVGKVSYVRDSRGRPLWMGPESFQPAQPGKPLRLAIDLEIQRLATEELVRGVYENNAAGGRLVVMDAATGEILAMVDVVRPVPDAIPFPWANADGSGGGGEGGHRYITTFHDPMRDIDPALGRNRCVQDIYEPGSTFKPFVWAAVTQLGAMRETDVVPTGMGTWTTPYGRTIHDVYKFAQLSWRDVLQQSSNIGMTQGALRLSRDQLRKSIVNFGFGQRTKIGLPAETAGILTPRQNWTNWTQTSVSFGQEVAVTPVQMARAFCIFARNGPLAGTLPEARLIAPELPDRADLFHRVVDPKVVQSIREILSGVAAKMEETMARKDKTESSWRYAIFGKSGTAQIPLGKAPKGKRKPTGNKGYFEKQFNSSFIAAGPTENPKLVCLVVIDDPGPELRPKLAHFGSHTAGPVVRRVLEKSLMYLGVPPSPPTARVVPAGPVGE
jgi:cell division protein FtsI/penicillin-binding protein 2